MVTGDNGVAIPESLAVRVFEGCSGYKIHNSNNLSINDCFWSGHPYLVKIHIATPCRYLVTGGNRVAIPESLST